MRAALVVLVIVVALVLQTTVSRVMTSGSIPIDLVLVAVVYAALKGGPTMGLLAGTFGGLLQDALSNSVIGIGGLAKSTVGFLAGVIGTQFIVAKGLPRLVVFAGATVVHAAVFMGLNELLSLRTFESPYAAVALQAGLNSLIGVLGLQVADMLPGAVERRRMARPRLRR